MRAAFIFTLLAAWALPSPAIADPARHEAVARQAIEQMLGRGRLELVPDLYRPDFVFHGDDRDYSLGEVVSNMGSLRAAFPDLSARVERIVAADDLVSIHWSATGTNSVRTGGFPGNGRRINFAGMAFVRFRGGRMAEEWAVQDSLTLLRQLDLLPSPARG